MPPKVVTSKKTKRGSTRLKTVKLDSAPVLSQAPPVKKFKPLTAFSASPPIGTESVASQSRSQGRQKIDAKGKGKATTQTNSEDGGNKLTFPGANPFASSLLNVDDRLWVDIFEPTTEEGLAVHKKKVEDVRRWFSEAFQGGPSGKLRKFRRILALTGPAGAAKTTTVRVLAREMGFEVVEWRNSVGENYVKHQEAFVNSKVFFLEVALNICIADDVDEFLRPVIDHETLMDKFESFLHRASSCHLFRQNHTPYRSQSSLHSQSQSSSNTGVNHTPFRQIILLEDLPNILHSDTKERFHAILRDLVSIPVQDPPVPIVVIVSDTGVRGEASDERLDQGGAGTWGKDEVVDIRRVLPRDLLLGPYVTQIGFNPIAPTLLRRALQTLVSLHATVPNFSKESLEVIAENSNGDIRSAVMALQFACAVDVPSSKKGKRSGSKVLLENVTRREQSLALFHLLGKVMYNKRKGDPPNHSATTKDKLRVQELDSRLMDPPPLPPFLAAHDRRGSRVDVETIYADSPIDSSLFSLYIHQNYPQFCDDIEGQCEGVSEWLSWVDSSGGEAWYQANPHRFHLLTLGTLHSLPSPVPRRSQKYLKPELFDTLRKQREAEDAVSDVSAWLLAENVSISRWSRKEIITELGGVLKMRDKTISPVPVPHKLFTSLMFQPAGTSGLPLNEGDVPEEAELHDSPVIISKTLEAASGGWLENDDIEES